MKRKNQLVKERYSLLKSVIALFLIVVCLIAANWQFNRGKDRHQINSKIIQNLAKPNLTSLPLDPKALNNQEWRTITLVGRYLTGTDLLKRNSYYEGEYGYEYLTKFETTDGFKLWVDRGWVKAGADAVTKPNLPLTPNKVIEIEGRVRSGQSMLQGKFFAQPSKPTNTELKIDLLKSEGQLVLHPAELPTLSDGPHYAYSLQWLFFAGLVGYGRFLIRRQALSSK